MDGPFKDLSKSSQNIIYLKHQIFKLENQELQKTNSILKVYKLVIKISPQNFSSQKIKYFLRFSPKSPQKEAFMEPVSNRSCLFLKFSNQFQGQIKIGGC